LDIDKDYAETSRFEEIQICFVFLAIFMAALWVISPVKENNKSVTKTLDLNQ
jgi:hypothetical protein